MGLRVSVAAVATVIAAAFGAASAQAAPVVVAQQGEPGPVLLAHRYVAPATGQQTLTIAVKPNSDFRTLTLLDFDRDGNPDALVNLYWNAPTQQVTWQLWKYFKNPLAPALGSGGGTCFVPGPVDYATNSAINPGAHGVSIAKTTSSWQVTVTANFEQALGDIARYQPRMLTIASTMANSLGSGGATASDYLPNSGAPSAAPADTGCMGRSPDDPGGVYRPGLLVNPRGWTDRGEVTDAPSRRQRMLDDTEHGESDLVEADIEQWDAAQPSADVTAAAAAGTVPSNASFHPADLVLRFAHGGDVASTTYLLSSAGTAPTGLVVTAAGSRAGRATVELHYGLSGLSGNRCYPRTSQFATSSSGTDWGPAPLSLDLPITTDEQGNQVVRVALDELIGVYQNGAGDNPWFNWLTASVPSGFGAPDYIPDVTAPTSGTGYCTYDPGTPGTTSDDGAGTVVDPGKAVHMATPLPTATLTPSTATPGRTAPITLTAGSDIANGFRFQSTGHGAFDALTAGNTRTGLVYASPATPRVYVTASNGAAQMADAAISPENTPPTANWNRTGATAPFVLGDPAGVTVQWNDASTDPDPGSSIAKRAWTLTQDGTSRTYTSSTALMAHTFNVGDQGNWTVTLTVTDDQGATATKTESVRVVQPPVAIIDRITPCLDPGADRCATGSGPIVWNQYSGGQFRAWARTATDGSLGSEGPLDYYFQWEPPNGSWNRWTLGYGDSYETWPGSYEIRMKVVDADGRTSNIATGKVNVRAPGDNPPTATATSAPAQPKTGDAVLIDASNSVLNNPDGTTEKAYSFEYDFGDGTAPMTTTQDAVTHVYAGSGRYTVTVTAFDDRSFANHTASDPFTLDLAVASGPGDVNAPKPVLRRESPAGKVYANRDVVLSAVGSTVKTGPAHYAWDLDGDGAYETDGGTQAVLTTRFASAGHRDVRVRVTDGDGRVAASAPLGVDVAAEPILAPTVALSGPDTAVMGDDGYAHVNLDASASHGNNDDPSLTYLWDLDGDGTYETDTAAIAKATARLPLAGDQTVRVLATDVFGNKATATKTIFVRSAADIAAGCTDREQYRVVRYGVIHAAACWTPVARPNAGPLWIAHGDVALNGLRLSQGSRGRAADQTFADCVSDICQAAQRLFNDEGKGSRLAFDLNDGHLVSNGPVAVKAAGSGVSLTLNDGPLDVVLPSEAGGDGLLLHPPGGAQLLTLDLAHTAEVLFPAAGQATVGMTVHLPPQMPGAGGDVTLRSTETQGLLLDHLKIEVQTGLLSDYLKLADLSIEYDRPEQQWTGHAELGLPAIKGKEFGLEVELSIKNGKFKSIYGAVDGLEVSLGEGIFLQRLRAGVGVDPLDLQGGIGISAGPKIGGIQLLSADGDFRITFPSAQYPYTLFQIAGGTKLFDMFDLEHGVVRFTSNGFFEARYGYTRDVGIAYFDADLGGWFTPSMANFTGNAEAGIEILGDRVKLIGVHAVLSTRGIAACGEIPVIDLGGGVGYRWGDKFNVFKGCDLGPYSEARPEGIPEGFGVRTAAVKAPAVVLPAGLRSAGVTVTGRGGPPKVRLVDTKGTTVLDATHEVLDETTMVQFDPNTSTTSILWKHPPKGRYLVLAADGSPGIARVGQAIDRGPQRVRASVTGPAGHRRVGWKVTPALEKGQSLVLGEALALDGAGREVTTTTKSSGSMAFTPQDGHGERRVITATIVTDGLGRPSVVAGRFTAPRPVRPAKPRGVSLARAKRTVTVRWTPGRTGTPAGGWRVVLRAGDLRTETALVKGARRSVTFKGVPGALAVRAEVAGLTPSRVAGAKAVATMAAGATRSGAVAGSVVPRGVTARRSGSRLVVGWRPGGAPVAGYVVRVRVGAGAPVTLTTTARRHRVSLRGLPKRRAAVRVEVRSRGLDGRLSRPSVLTGRR